MNEQKTTLSSLRNKMENNPDENGKNKSSFNIYDNKNAG